MKLKESGNKYDYFLHYMGWNSRWDKWVSESDLMAAGPEAQEMQKQLKEKQQQEKVGVIALMWKIFNVFVEPLFIHSVSRT